MSREPAVESGERRAQRFEAFIAAVAAIAAYATSLRNGFTIDDSYIVVDNGSLRDLRNIPSFFVRSWGGEITSDLYARMNAGYYRPLTSTLQALEMACFGTDPLGFHVVSVVLHAVATLLALAFARRLLGGSRPYGGAFVCALLFAAHPIHAEAVNPATYQSTLLAACLAFGALHVGCSPRGRARALVTAGLSLLAALAKEEGVVVLPLLVAHELLRPSEDRPRRPDVATVVAFGAGILVYAVLRAGAVHGTGMSFFGDAPLIVRIYTMATVVVLYARLLLVPWPFCPFYDWYIVPIATSPSDPGVLVGFGIALVTALGVVALRRRGFGAAAFALAFVPISLLPVLQLVPILIVAAERFLYLGSFGFFALVGVLAERRRRVRDAALVTALVLMAITSFRNLDWHDDTSLNRAYARDFPESPTPHLNLADLAVAQGDLAAALHELERVRALDPTLPRGYLEAIRFELRLGRTTRAQELARSAVAHGIDPRRVDAALRAPLAPMPPAP